MKIKIALLCLMILMVFTTLTVQGCSTKTERWEYKLQRFTYEDDQDDVSKMFNELGLLGWEYVGVVPSYHPYACFKRRLP